jgi:hypothetical protein
MYSTNPSMLPIELKQCILRFAALKELVAITRPRYIFGNYDTASIEIVRLFGALRTTSGCERIENTVRP